MGRGFGRGAKSVGIVTHSQVKNAKKTPKGLRSSRRKKRERYHQQDAQQQLEESMGITEQQQQKGKKNQKQQEEVRQGKSLAQEIAGVAFEHVLNKRQRGFKQLRRQLLTSVKDVRRRYVQKKTAQAKRDEKLLAARYEREQKKRRKGRVATSDDEDGDDA